MGNKISKNEQEHIFIRKLAKVIGEDENQAENDMQGESVFNLSSESLLYRGAKKALFSLLEEN